MSTVTTQIPARMDRLPWSRWHWLVVLGLGTVWILDGLEVTIVGAIASRLQEKEALGLSASQVGVAGTFYIVGAAIGALTFGHLTDRLGRKRLFMATLVLYLVATVLTAFAWDALSFWAFRFLTGLGIGGEYAAINSAIDELIPARVRGWVDVAINGSFWLGAAAGAALSVVLLDTSIFSVDLGWRLAFALGAVLGIAIALVRRFVPESPRWMMIHGRAEEAERLVAGIEDRVRRDTGLSELEEPDQEIEIEQRKSTNFVEVGRTLFSRYPRRSALGFALLGTQAFIYNAVLFTFSIVLVDFFSVGEAVAGVYLVPFALANFLGALLLGRFFDTIGRRAMIAGTYLISAVGFGVLTVLFAQEQLGLTGFLLLLCGSFFFASAAASAGYLTVSEIFPRRRGPCRSPCSTPSRRASAGRWARCCSAAC
jgi:MFS family permease